MTQLGDKTIRVCFFGTYRSDYTRHQVMRARLLSAGMAVQECHVELWKDNSERVQAASGKWLRLDFLWRVLKTYFRLLKQYFSHVTEYDVLWIGYPGLFDALIGKILSGLRRKPLVWDICLSVYLVSLERGLDRVSRLTTLGLHWMEKTSAHFADLLLLETNAYIHWFASEYALPESQFRLAPLGADDAFIHQTAKVVSTHGEHVILFYGTFHPNSGVPYIVEAARLLQDHPEIRFELIGDGPELTEVCRRVNEYSLGNVQLSEWMPKELLIEKISAADVCLGSFGDTTQSMISVHNKIYESLAMSKAVITGDSPAMREAMQHGVNIYLVERANPPAIAEAIVKLLADNSLRDSLSINGHRLFISHFTNQELGAQLKEYLSALIASTEQA